MFILLQKSFIVFSIMEKLQNLTSPMTQTFIYLFAYFHSFISFLNTAEQEKKSMTRGWDENKKPSVMLVAMATIMRLLPCNYTTLGIAFTFLCTCFVFVFLAGGKMTACRGGAVWRQAGIYVSLLVFLQVLAQGHQWEKSQSGKTNKRAKVLMKNESR